MAEVYRNVRDVNMMVWETKPLVNKKNNIVKLISEKHLQVGDVVEGDMYFWEVIEVMESRPSVFVGKQYITVKMDVRSKA